MEQWGDSSGAAVRGRALGDRVQAAWCPHFTGDGAVQRHPRTLPAGARSQFCVPRGLTLFLLSFGG